MKTQKSRKVEKLKSRKVENLKSWKLKSWSDHLDKMICLLPLPILKWTYFAYTHPIRVKLICNSFMNIQLNKVKSWKSKSQKVEKSKVEKLKSVLR